MSVKRNQFIKHLTNHSCFLRRHDSQHDIYQNSVTKKKTPLPRPPKLDKNLCDLICKQLEIPKL
jgi:hypothetical protein